VKKFAFFLIILFSAAVFAQPQIAVYVTGNIPDSEKRALGTSMFASFVNSGRYIGIERHNYFLAEIDKATRLSEAIDDRQISALGRQFGVKFVCIADITSANGSFQVSARIVDVETAAVVCIGESSFGQLDSMADLAIVSDNVVKNMLSNQTTTTPQPEPSPAVTVSQASVEPEKPKPSNIPTTAVSKNYDRYFTLRYMPVASSVYLGPLAHNVEMGWIWRNGMFLGFDFGVALIDDIDVYGFLVGGGLDIGKSFELANEFNFVFGGSLGFWGWDDYHYDNSYYDNYDKSGFSWIGPFVRLRYRIFELSYRVLLGTTEEERNGSEPSSGLGAINQVGIGLHFEGSDRFGQPRNYDDYFALRYLPVASPVYVSPIAYNIEYGWILRNGMFMGIDGVLATGDDFDKQYIGGGFNIGKSLELANDFNLALGGSLGYWWGYDVSGIYEKSSDSWIGPFVRLRYRIYELSYRVLLGTTEEGRYFETTKPSIGFSNQVGIGLYFEGKKRHR
jgi:hypothetical protein